MQQKKYMPIIRMDFLLSLDLGKGFRRVAVKSLSSEAHENGFRHWLLRAGRGTGWSFWFSSFLEAETERLERLKS